MNIADILRKLADSLEGGEAQPEAPEVSAEPEVEVSDCGCGDEPEMAPQDEPAAPEGDDAAWMPPQTQEMELLKKMAGEPNEFDGGEGSDEDMDRLKKLAGISVVQR